MENPYDLLNYEASSCHTLIHEFGMGKRATISEIPASDSQVIDSSGNARLHVHLLVISSRQLLG